MGIRESINKNPTITAAVTGGIILLAMVFILWNTCSSGGGGADAVGKTFFSIDDGKTFYPDDANKIPPYTKDGKQAVRAHVFTCDGGKTKFVGYLEMYTPEEKKMMEDAIAGKAPAAVYAGYTGQAMVKRPGAPKWIKLMPGSTTAYQQTVQVQCPGGTGTPERVYPD